MRNEYIFLADLLNKFSQLTPWVQAIIGVSVSFVVLGITYFFKESIIAIMKPLYKKEKPSLVEFMRNSPLLDEDLNFIEK